MACDESQPPSTSADAITVVASNGKEFVLDLELTEQSETLAKLVLNFEYDQKDVEKHPVPLGNVTSAQMEKVIVWLNHHRNHPKWVPNDKNYVPVYTFDRWVDDYLNISNSDLYELVNVANYLNIPRLFDTVCRKIASKLTGKTTAEMLVTFNIKPDPKKKAESESEVVEEEEKSTSSEECMSDISLSPPQD